MLWVTARCFAGNFLADRMNRMVGCACGAMSGAGGGGTEKARGVYRLYSARLVCKASDPLHSLPGSAGV